MSAESPVIGEAVLQKWCMAACRAHPGIIRVVLSTKEAARFSPTRVGERKKAMTHVELRLVLAPNRHKIFAARKLRVEQRLERMVKYMRYFTWRGVQVV
jgi:hypothetical protein